MKYFKCSLEKEALDISHHDQLMLISRDFSFFLPIFKLIISWLSFTNKDWEIFSMLYVLNTPHTGEAYFSPLTAGDCLTASRAPRLCATTLFLLVIFFFFCQHDSAKQLVWQILYLHSGFYFLTDNNYFYRRQESF